MQPNYQIVQALVFDCLKDHQSGQLEELVAAVVEKASSQGQLGLPRRDKLQSFDRAPLRSVVQQILWQLLVQNVACWGRGDSNDNYPFFRLTDYGKRAVAKGKPQPYDPDGFLKEFDRQIPAADQVVRDYLVEAVRAFNANCPRAAAVLIGAASEKAILLLHEQFAKQITDPSKKKKFDKDSDGLIYRKYGALQQRLDLMVAAKKLSRELSETIKSELPSGFELIRRYRNSAGHPEMGGAADEDTIFLNLRTFIEYARRVHALITHFQTNAADW